MRSVDDKIKLTGCVHSNQNQGVYLIKHCACWSAPSIVNKINTTATKEGFNVLFSFVKTSQFAGTGCDCKDVNVIHVNVYSFSMAAERKSFPIINILCHFFKKTHKCSGLKSDFAACNCFLLKQMVFILLELCVHRFSLIKWLNFYN